MFKLPKIIRALERLAEANDRAVTDAADDGPAERTGRKPTQAGTP
jgi:hypothetical protein